MKFKVGDVVKRVDQSHPCGMKVGSTGTITRVYNDGGLALAGSNVSWGSAEYFIPLVPEGYWIDAFGIRHDN